MDLIMSPTAHEHKDQFKNTILHILIVRIESSVKRTIKILKRFSSVFEINHHFSIFHLISSNAHISWNSLDLAI